MAGTIFRHALCQVSQHIWKGKVQLAHHYLYTQHWQFWHWAATITLWKSIMSSNAVFPIYKPDGVTLITDSQQIGQAWCSHYAMLAADVTGCSCDQEYWQHISEY